MHPLLSPGWPPFSSPNVPGCFAPENLHLCSLMPKTLLSSALPTAGHSSSRRSPLKRATGRPSARTVSKGDPCLSLPQNPFLPFTELTGMCILIFASSSLSHPHSAPSGQELCLLCSPGCTRTEDFTRHLAHSYYTNAPFLHLKPHIGHPWEFTEKNQIVKPIKR